MKRGTSLRRSPECGYRRTPGQEVRVDDDDDDDEIEEYESTCQGKTGSIPDRCTHTRS